MTKLIEILKLYDPDNAPIADPQFCDTVDACFVRLRFTADGDGVLASVDSPVIIPFYNCPVTDIGIDSDEDGTLEIWLDYKEYTNKIIKEILPTIDE